MLSVHTEQQAVGADALLATPMGRTNMSDKPTPTVCPIVETDVDAGEFPLHHNELFTCIQCFSINKPHRN